MKKHLYATMTWEEVNEAVKERRVIVVPVAAIEQHGRHLPIDVDNVCATSIAEQAAAKAPDVLIAAPPIHYGFNEHNMDFPGTITIQMETLLNFAFEVGQSLAEQGFRRILWLNGHGSNAPVYQLVARKVTNRTKALSAFMNWWDIAWPMIEQTLDGLPRSVSHACELETSAYLHLRGDLVKTELIADDIAATRGGPDWLYPLLGSRSPIHFMNWWSTYSKEGVNGNPSLATAEKGRKIVEYAADRLVQIAREFRDMPTHPRVDYKVRPDEA